ASRPCQAPAVPKTSSSPAPARSYGLPEYASYLETTAYQRTPQSIDARQPPIATGLLLAAPCQASTLVINNEHRAL
ncbi:MAG: hypothetical protein MUP62_05450, partial [Dehalococcoidia bacterium]|nr:hypothetical protein [Dehalococcoidia bacterium]